MRKNREATIAKMILAAIRNMTCRYVFVEERYSDKEYERVQGLVQCRKEHVASSISKVWNAYKRDDKVQDVTKTD